jgi:hypothetical protein
MSLESFFTMNMQTENRVKIRLFAGCVVTSELRLQLNQSLLWKQASIAPNRHDLEQTHFHQKDYIGLFLKEDKISLDDLEKVEANVLHYLKAYCPQFASEKLRILVLSQVFIS